jgi:acetyl esterase/lipase
MASPESERVVAELWGLPSSDGVSLEKWRHVAGWRERVDLPEGVATLPVDAGGVPAEWSWLRGVEEGGPVVVFVHGGGWVLCSIGTHRVLAAHVAAAVGGRALVVGYRLAPESPFPAGLDDCCAAYRWLLAQGVDPARVVLAGDSAGGNLVVATALALRDQGVALPAALVTASPAPDLTFRGGSNRTNRSTDPFSRLDDMERMSGWYLQGHDPTDPLASPVYGDLTGLPPLLVLVGPGETLLDDAAELARVAARDGVDTTFEVVDGAFHTWLGYVGEVPEADASIERIGRFMAEHTRG